MSNPASAVVDGVNVDALAAAVRSCTGVDDLDGGLLGCVATYQPGRQLSGIRIGSDRVTIQVRGRWDVPVRELAAQIRVAVAPLVGGRTVDIVVADLADPAPPDSAPQAQGAPQHSSQPAAIRQEALVSSAAEDNSELWMTTNTADAPAAGSSSAPITPTEGVTPPSS
jgi:hypothetical protein